LIGATTRAGMISSPLRDRFGMHFRLQFYNKEELAQIIIKASHKLNKICHEDGALEIARRSRGTPRISLRLLKRVRDFADVENEEKITKKRCEYALIELGVNNLGFDELDIKYLELLIEAKGRALGLNTLAAALSEDEGTIEDVIEPYLLANGYMQRTARGRVASTKCYELFKLTPLGQGGLFEG
ncbi:MAG: Holliday junction branch migration DNA helicase RuvB, partial [Epsilonproteobacteria bacterium]|nr:Holliday junction branch migration DNA helicase RuvB [Campylobacterota bacterium]